MSIPFMDDVNKLTLVGVAVPERLRQVSSPPKKLFTAGAALKTLLGQPCVAIVGSRKVSPYGREVTMKLAYDLAARGVVIISGLALGVDSLAHKAAIEAGGKTIAVLPSPLDKIYPSAHTPLAHQVLSSGGALVSEYEAGADIFTTNFIARNRLIAGLCQLLLITEAAEKSGSLHTARFALEQGRDVMAVPGSIFSETSKGTNNLLKAGATPVTDYTDVLHVLGIEEIDLASNRTMKGANEAEQAILDLLLSGTRDGDILLTESKLEVTLFNQTLTMLEITGKIRPIGAGQWAIS